MQPRPESLRRRHDDAEQAAAAVRVRRERMAALSMAERLQRLHELCRALAAVAGGSQPRR